MFRECLPRTGHDLGQLWGRQHPAVETHARHLQDVTQWGQHQPCESVLWSAGGSQRKAQVRDAMIVSNKEEWIRKIWQMSQQHYCQVACQISEWYHHFNTQSPGFETLQELMIRQTDDKMSYCLMNRGLGFTLFSTWYFRTPGENEVVSLLGHCGAVYSTSFTQHNAFLLSASEDTTGNRMIFTSWHIYKWRE